MLNNERIYVFLIKFYWNVKLQLKIFVLHCWYNAIAACCLKGSGLKVVLIKMLKLVKVIHVYCGHANSHGE